MQVAVIFQYIGRPATASQLYILQHCKVVAVCIGRCRLVFPLTAPAIGPINHQSAGCRQESPIIVPPERSKPALVTQDFCEALHGCTIRSTHT